MAVEVDQKTYLFRPMLADHTVPRAPRKQLFRKAIQHKSQEVVANKAPWTITDNNLNSHDNSPFTSNPIHDMESIWWIAVYFVVNKEARFISDPDFMPVAASQHQLASQLFYLRSHRVSALLGPLLKDNASALAPCVQPIVEVLLKLRTKLVTYYQDCEQTLHEKINEGAWWSIHDDFADEFFSIVQELETRDVLVRPFCQEPTFE
jgi:hypothetical protein